MGRSPLDEAIAEHQAILKARSDEVKDLEREAICTSPSPLPAGGTTAPRTPSDATLRRVGLADA